MGNSAESNEEALVEVPRDDVETASIIQRDEFDPANRSVSVDVVETVAEVANARPSDLPPLPKYVDPDCLDTIFGNKDSTTESTNVVGMYFEYGDYLVHLEANGYVSICSVEDRR